MTPHQIGRFGSNSGVSTCFNRIMQRSSSDQRKPVRNHQLVRYLSSHLEDLTRCIHDASRYTMTELVSPMFHGILKGLWRLWGKKVISKKLHDILKFLLWQAKQTKMVRPNLMVHGQIHEIASRATRWLRVHLIADHHRCRRHPWAYLGKAIWMVTSQDYSS